VGNWPLAISAGWEQASLPGPQPVMVASGRFQVSPIAASASRMAYHS
jgi:hypothetical protein